MKMIYHPAGQMWGGAKREAQIAYNATSEGGGGGELLLDNFVFIFSLADPSYYFCQPFSQDFTRTAA